jgi:3-methyladenine DNA glycosylase AlkD
MKTEMPCYGVKKPERRPILRELTRRWPPHDRDEYEALVLELWNLEHREEKYLAIGVARHHEPFIEPASVPLYRRLIIEGAWWDFVDEIAANLIGRVLLQHRRGTTPMIRRWSSDPDMWLRRTAIISQLRHRDQTDASLLFECCRTCAHEKEFFIRKAIGWALRAYAKTNPKAVREFVAREQLSALSKREALKNL